MARFERFGGLGPRACACYGGPTRAEAKGKIMAEEEPLLASPPTQDTAWHVRDYQGFVKLFKWGAIISFAIAMFVIVIIS